MNTSALYQVNNSGVIKSLECWQLIVPLHDNSGEPFDQAMIEGILERISLTFPGLTAISCAGMWHSEGTVYRDRNLQILIDAVPESREKSAGFFSQLKRDLQVSLGQEKIYVTLQSSKEEMLTFEEFFLEVGIEPSEFRSTEELVRAATDMANRLDFVMARMGYRTVTLRRDIGNHKIVWEREVAGIRLRSEFDDPFPSDISLVAADRFDDLARALGSGEFAIFGEFEFQFYCLAQKPFKPIVHSSLHNDPEFPGKPYKSQLGDQITVGEFVEKFTSGVAANVVALRDHGYLPEEIRISVGSDGSLQYTVDSSLGTMMFHSPAHIPVQRVQMDIIRCLDIFCEQLEQGRADSLALQQAKAGNGYIFKRAMMKRFLPPA